MITEVPVIGLLTVEMKLAGGSFILNKSKLGEGFLGPEVPAAWVPYLGKANSVTASRGGKRSGLKTSIDAGTLTITLVNTADPVLSTELKPNMPIRLISLAGIVLWTGSTIDVNTAYVINAKGGFTTYVTITAADPAQVHATTPRNGAIVGSGLGHENWPARVRRLSKSSRLPVIVPIVDDVEVTDYRLASTVYQGSLSAHFDLVANSVGARWYVGKDGVTRWIGPSVAPSLPAHEFNDEPGMPGLKYANIGTAYDTRNVVNTLTLNQHGTMIEDYEIKANDRSSVYRDVTSVATWGPRADGLETNLYEDKRHPEIPGPLHRAREIFEQHRDPAVQFTSLTWNAQNDPEVAADLEIYMPIKITFRGVTQVRRIINIKHTITPTRWMIDLQLIGE